MYADEIAKGREIFQRWLSDLESGQSNRGITITLLMSAAKMDINAFRKYGTTSENPDLPAVVSTFLKVLSKDQDSTIRAKVAKGLGKIAHDISRYQIYFFQDTAELVETKLIEALQDDSPQVRKAATKALQRIGTPSALAKLPPKINILDRMFGRKR